MNHTYHIEISAYKKIRELHGAWSIADYQALLELCDVDDTTAIADEELFDYLSMALQELEPDEAAAIIINYRLGNRLSKGQIQNISHDIQEENLWEEYQDMALHEELYNITALLFKAFNGKFPQPEATELTMKITALTGSREGTLMSFNESLIARIVALGQDDHSIINRLFDEKIAGPKFDEAKDIIWSYEVVEHHQTSVTLHITTGSYWVIGLQNNSEFEVNTHNDHA